MVISYDVDVSRVTRINKLLKRYLYWRLNSVFEGELSPPQLEEVKVEVREIIDKEVDSVLIYKFPSKKSFQLELLGVEKNPIEHIL